ncbi:hypothetical protein [Roseicella sp. DB1501]|uniref:hypothetical protein n=1 Tax=Roseicella sp. DB1501 TaxID=2730925 RepID=UPI001492E228|nr:hypothetical protein [Roseicella sp. DB1501]NOG69622.1 hypothetical protein [Roseicella sp. DB1501]
MTTAPTIFADGILDANVSYGVARLTLAQTGPEGKPMAAGQLVVPLIQLPGIVNGLTGLLKQVETKIREQQAQQQQTGGGTAEPASSAFRFG